MTARRNAETGQVSVLIIGFAIVLLLGVGVVVDSSAAYLQRQGLDNLADGAALAGADQVRGDGAYDGGLDGERAPLAQAEVHAEVGRYLRQVGAYGEYPGLSYRVRIVDQRVIVSVRAPMDLPFEVQGITDTTVSSTGSASTLLRES